MSRGYRKTYRKMKSVYKNVELERRPFPKPLLILIICAAAFVAVFFAVRALVSFVEEKKLPTLVQETGSLNEGGSGAKIYMKSPGGKLYNPLTGNKAADFLKDERGNTLVPLSGDRKQTVFISASKDDIRQLSYQIRNAATGELTEETIVENLNSVEGGTEATLQIKDLLNENRQYNLQLKLEMQDGPVSLYNTTVELMGDVWADEKLAYVEMITGLLYDSTKSEEVSEIFYSLSDTDGTNFAKAGYNSIASVLMWEGLSPETMEPPVPSIVKVDEDSTKITQSYLLELTASEDDKSRVIVNEAFSVKMTNSGDVKLVNYDRSAYETLKNPQAREGSISLGFQADDNVNITVSENENYSAFINGGNLWLVAAGRDSEKSKFTRVFSLEKEDGTITFKTGKTAVNDEGNITGIEGEYGINILSLDNEGNVKFTVYGTFPGGFRSGETGIGVYTYSKETQELSELLFIPETGEFSSLKKASRESYLNDKGEFFTVKEGTLYRINTADWQVSEIASAQKEKRYAVSEKGSAFAAEGKEKIITYDCDNNALKEISKDPDEEIYLVGYSGENLVYCRGKSENESPDGKKYMDEIRVIDKEGNEKISYKEEGVYYSDVSVYETGVKYKEYSKEAEGSFKEIKDGRIVAKEEENKNPFTLVFETEAGKRKQLKLYFDKRINSDDGEPVIIKECKYMTGSDITFEKASEDL